MYLDYDVSVFSYDDYVSFIEDVYLDIRQKKGAFSQRDYAKTLGLSAPRINQIINRKEGLSASKAMKLSTIFDFSDSEREYFYHLVASRTSRCHKQKNESRKYISDNYSPLGKNYQSYEKWSLLDLEGWNVIWNLIGLREDCNSISELSKISSFKFDKVDRIIQKMVDLELVQVLDGEVVKLTNNIAFGNSISSKSVQAFHRAQALKAIEALEEPIDERKFESITFTMNKRDYSNLCSKIEKFIDTITNDLEKEEHDEIVSINVALYKEVKSKTVELS